VEITVRVRWAIIVDHNVDSLHIDTTSEDISGNQDTLLKRLEGSVARNTAENVSHLVGHIKTGSAPLILLQARVDANAWKVARDEKLIQLNSTRHRLDENDDLTLNEFYVLSRISRKDKPD
jgi:hypothetical protein